MPKYELMYIIGSHISDDQIPQVVEETKKIIDSSGGVLEKHEELGKRKLAYPIKKSKNGFYIVANFSAPAERMNEIEHKIRNSQGIIRHLIINMDQGLLRMEKDRLEQAKLKLLRPRAEAPKETPGKPEKKIEIDLDAEIEKALESEELK